MAVAALKQASLVVLLTSFKNVAALDYADVMLPIAAFAETSGTYVNTEGRVQGVAGVCRPQGEARPAWKVLRVLGNVLGLPGFEYESSEQVRDELIPSGTEFVEGLDNGVELRIQSIGSYPSGLQRIADVPIYFADSLVRRAVSLQQTKDAAIPAARMNPQTLAELGVVVGSRVRVRQDQGEAVLTACSDSTVPAGCVRIAAAHPTTAALGEMFGPIDVERA